MDVEKNERKNSTARIMPICIDALKCLLCLQRFVIYLPFFFFTCLAEVVDILKRNNKRAICRRQGIFKLPFECALKSAKFS